MIKHYAHAHWEGDLPEGKGTYTEILLKTKGTIPEISKDKFEEIANSAKENCPVSKALKDINISLQVQLT